MSKSDYLITTVAPFKIAPYLFLMDSKLLVITIIGCQFDYIWNYLKPKELGKIVKVFFLIYVFEVERPTLNPDFLRW